MIKSHFTIAWGIVPLVLTAGLATPAPSSAEQVSRFVSYRDLDLTRPAHIAVLERRIGRAAVRICGGQVPAPIAERQARYACMGEVRASAGPQMRAVVDLAFARADDLRQASRLAANDQ